MAEHRQQCGDGSRSAAVAAVVATIMTIKMKVMAAAAAAWRQRSVSAALAEAEAWRQWQRWLDHPSHNLTPLPVQAGEDAAGIHPTPPATIALFGFGFLANLIL